MTVTAETVSPVAACRCRAPQGPGRVRSLVGEPRVQAVAPYCGTHPRHHVGRDPQRGAEGPWSRLLPSSTNPRRRCRGYRPGRGSKQAANAR